MKKLFTLLALIATTAIFAQAPQGFNYQATVRNSSGALVVNQNVNFKFNVMLNSQTSVPVFSETHYVPTDDLGQVNLVIGQGTATTGSFSAINWGTGNYYLGIELNTGSGYVAMGTTQLLSVPYALYANSSGNSQATTPSLASVLAVNNGANNLQIKNLADPTEAQDAVNKSYVDALESRINILENIINNNIPLPISDIDGNTYQTEKIGNQVYTTNNLNVTKYRNGDIIPQVTDSTQWANLTTGAWCYYNNDPANGAIYGKLYNWYAVNDPRGLAPEGWHVPSHTEWINFSGFVLSGLRSTTGTFGQIETYGNWWTSTEIDATSVYVRSYSLGLLALQGGAGSNKNRGYAVRCIKD